MRENLTKEFEKVHSLSLTTDLWSNRQMRSYIGITGHYILNWRMNSVMVACHRFQGRHTACNILYEVFQDIVVSYKISNKISSIITDNALNMVKAFSLPGYIKNQILVKVRMIMMTIANIFLIMKMMYLVYFLQLVAHVLHTLSNL